MIKVELDGKFVKGDLITQDPQFGSYYLVKSVEGLIHTLNIEEKGLTELIEGKKMLKMGNVSGESEKFPSPFEDFSEETKPIHVIKIH